MPRADLHIPGDHAAVTAGGAGIGRTIVSHLARAGVNVAVNDVDADALAATRDALADAPGRVLTVPGDAGDPDAMSAFVEETTRTFGGLDILVNNIGVPGPTAPAEAVSHDAFMETLRVDVGGPFAATRAAIPQLRDGDEGRVVTIASRTGKKPHPDRLPYATAKMALIGFTRTLAAELAPDGITVNAVCPGVVAGDRLDRVIAAHADEEDRPADEIAAEYRAESPMTELTQPEDVADAVLFLCSGRAARMTGQDLNVTAGRVMY